VNWPVGRGWSRDLYAEMESTLLKYLMQHFDQKPSVLASELKMNRATLLKKRRHLGLSSEKGKGFSESQVK